MMQQQQLRAPAAFSQVCKPCICGRHHTPLTNVVLVVLCVLPFLQFTRDRPRAERIAVDCDISAGWMHNGYPIMAYQSEADRLQLPKWIGRDDGWGWFHELGEST